MVRDRQDGGGRERKREGGEEGGEEGGRGRGRERKRERERGREEEGGRVSKVQLQQAWGEVT